jgi:hypothetical protein
LFYQHFLFKFNIDQIFVFASRASRSLWRKSAVYIFAVRKVFFHRTRRDKKNILPGKSQIYMTTGRRAYAAKHPLSARATTLAQSERERACTRRALLTGATRRAVQSARRRAHIKKQNSRSPVLTRRKHGQPSGIIKSGAVPRKYFPFPPEFFDYPKMEKQVAVVVQSDA